ncbi:DJ-1/PfpI family protein [Candidatus Methylospira mobilis]|uniref:DJ-1/PfpI family protein n=1 Tax=Candidatus Methylospira mobilis TaxID=1808979 RepID=UPI0028E5494D|nr:DJ-1/PfpI family protein [Candidatus Methylospira mobilis]WNV06263.1 DJ-1/PfpI family protein [Candidatus Methylospira mobilis]
MVQNTTSNKLQSYESFAQGISPPGTPRFRVGILIGPGFLPMDMVGVHAVFGFCPGVEIHLIWKSQDLVEGFPAWWTKPTTTFADCPELDVFAVPMLAPETVNDPEVIAFVAEKGRKAKYVIGVCNGVVLLGAAGLLKGKRVTTSLNSLPLLTKLGAAEVVTTGGVAVDGNLYTARPSIGSFEAALMVADIALGRKSAQLANLVIEYDPHPPLGPGTIQNVGKEIADLYEGLIADIIQDYSLGAISAYQQRVSA